MDDGVVFSDSVVVRPDAVNADRRIKFDGIARHLQNAGQDHLAASGHEQTHPHWIARRTVIELQRSGGWPERLSLHRWCSRMGSRWCNIRIDLDGDAGTSVKTEAFWINFNVDTGTPSRLGDDFTDKFGSTAEPGPLRWKPWLDTSPDPAATAVPFLLRAVDVDFVQHVNNAVYWSALEEALSQYPDLEGKLPVRAVIEHNTQLTLADSPRLLAYRDGDRLLVWIMVGDRNVASMAVETGDGDVVRDSLAWGSVRCD